MAETGTYNNYNTAWPFTYFTTATTNSTADILYNYNAWPFLATTSSTTILNQWPFQAGTYRYVPGSLLGQEWVRVEETPEQVAERERLREERIIADAERRRQETERYQAAQKQQQEAAAKAEELLQSILDPGQRNQLAADGYFEVTAKSGRRYRVKRGTHGNVYQLDARGRETHRLCVQPEGVPASDANATQKLMIETDEEAFRRTANITNLGRVA